MTTFRLANPPQTGSHAIESALIEAKLLDAKLAKNKYTPAVARAVEKAKFRCGYPLNQIHRGHEIAGQQILDFLQGKKELPDDFKARRRQRLGLTPLKPLPPIDTRTDHEKRNDAFRVQVVDEYRWLISREPQVHYSQTRPIPVNLAPRTIPPGGIRTDCSGAVTLACKWGGLPDPNGNKYSGNGFTGTLLNNLPHISHDMCRPGDLAVFGGGTGDHVVMILDTSHDDYECGSHGQERGPISIGLAAETAAQRRLGAFGVTYLRIVS